MAETPEPWNFTEAQRRQFREAHAQASILRAAEAERDHARQLLDEHYRAYAAPAAGDDCPDCALLEAHVVRTDRQVELLTPAEADMEAMW